MIVPFDALPALRKQHKKEKIVLGSGVFDLLHRGHVSYIQTLRKYGDIVVVLVKPDERVRLGKGLTRPIVPQNDRAAMVNALKGVDYVFIGQHIDWRGKAIDPMYEQALQALNPDVFCTTNPFWKQLEQTGITVVTEERPTAAPLSSTTDIIAHVLHKSKADQQ